MLVIKLIKTIRLTLRKYSSEFVFSVACSWLVRSLSSSLFVCFQRRCYRACLPVVEGARGQFHREQSSSKTCECYKCYFLHLTASNVCADTNSSVVGPCAKVQVLHWMLGRKNIFCGKFYRNSVFVKLVPGYSVCKQGTSDMHRDERTSVMVTTAQVGLAMWQHLYSEVVYQHINVWTNRAIWLQDIFQNFLWRKTKENNICIWV